jgi:hypothetical protein
MNIIDDIRSYCHTLSKLVAKTNSEIYKDGSNAAFSILPLLHRLLSLKTDSTEDQCQKMNMVRLGCILYFAEIRRLFGIMGIIHTHTTQKLRLLSEKQTGDWGSLEILKAWALAMAAIECGGAERKWFFEQLEISRNRLGISDWLEMERQFEEILWYGDVHSTLFGEVISGVGEVIRGYGELSGSRFGGYRPLV